MIEKIKARTKAIVITTPNKAAKDLITAKYDLNTLLCEVDRLTAELQTVKAEKDAAIKDLYEACTRSPCNNGICVTKNCTGNIIPCKFEWRGRSEQDG